MNMEFAKNKLKLNNLFYLKNYLREKILTKKNKNKGF